MKPLVYLAAFESGMDLDTPVPDEPIGVPVGRRRRPQVDRQLRQPVQGPDPDPPGPGRVAQRRGRVDHARDRREEVIRTAHQMGIRTPLQPYISTALGASEVRLLELADAYRAIASGVAAEPHVIDRVTDPPAVLYEAPRARGRSAPRPCARSRKGSGAWCVSRRHRPQPDARDFPIPVMGKTGTTSDFRDALFVGSTYGTQGITVAVRIGFDDNRPSGRRKPAGARRCRSSARSCSASTRTSSSGPPPRFPREIEDGIDRYLAGTMLPEPPPPPQIATQPVRGGDALLTGGPGLASRRDGATNRDESE
jgi:penicillin-binding protein 1A